MGVIILTSSWSKLGIGNVKRQLEGAAFFRNCNLAKISDFEPYGRRQKIACGDGAEAVWQGFISPNGCGIGII